MKAIILTYHSHHVLGAGYDVNDHVAFPADLELITALGYRIVELGELVQEATRRGFWRSIATRGTKLIALTFDDGPVFDACDFTHPVLGNQRSFLGAMTDFRESTMGKQQPTLAATSFVIASVEARLAMESSFDERYTYLQPGSMRDDWWSDAIDSGLIAIGNHSWDHLHPALPVVAHSRQAKANFTQVDNSADADLQIEQAARYIMTKTAGRGSPWFAYPFGHYNEFLVHEYLPELARRTGLQGAVTTDARPVRRNDSIWCLPRYTCGHHWKSSHELSRLLLGH